jgi:hypothetical protein
MAYSKLGVLEEKKVLTKATRDADRAQEEAESIHDPPILNHKSRPRTQCLTGPMEGCPQGGGAGNGAGMRELQTTAVNALPPTWT